MRKIFFFDIDNTLLDHHSGVIPAAAIAAIGQLKQAGHTFAIATGRSYGHARTYIDLLQPTYSITQNGARIYRGNHEVHQISLDRSSLGQLFHYLDAQKLVYGAINGSEGRVSADEDIVHAPMNSVQIRFHVDRDFHLHESVFQAWMFFDEAQDKVLLPDLIAKFPQFDYVRWHPQAMDVIPRGVNKLTGCQWVMRDAGMQAEHAIAFGDGLNDMEMLQGVGMGVAMGNAHPRLIAIADRVAPAIHQNGVASMVTTLLDELSRKTA